MLCFLAFFTLLLDGLFGLFLCTVSISILPCFLQRIYVKVRMVVPDLVKKSLIETFVGFAQSQFLRGVFSLFKGSYKLCFWGLALFSGHVRTLLCVDAMWTVRAQSKGF